MVARISPASMVVRSLVTTCYLLLLMSRNGSVNVHAKPWLEEQWDDDEAIFQIPQEDPRPFYIECIHSTECIKGYCCAIGRQRFALPRCMEHSRRDEPCYPDARSVKRNLTYPDGATVKLNGVYDLFCPCGYGLFCDPSTHTCQDNSFAHETNFLDD